MHKDDHALGILCWVVVTAHLMPAHIVIAQVAPRAKELFLGLLIQVLAPDRCADAVWVPWLGCLHALMLT
jgi:hypothetical protein